MKNQPTYEDAKLILKLYDLRREERLRAARKFMAASPQFASRAEFLTLCPPGSEENASYRMVTTYWEMAASFVATGVLNRELFFRANNLELLLVWEKIKVIVPEMRAAANNPGMARSMEEIANAFIAHLNEVSPGYYETFAANMAKMGR